MSAPAAESPAHQPGVMRSLEKLGLGATRALSALGLSALLFLAQSSEMRGPREAFTANWAKVIRLPILKATR